MRFQYLLQLNEIFQINSSIWFWHPRPPLVALILVLDKFVKIQMLKVQYTIYINYDTLIMIYIFLNGSNLKSSQNSQKVPEGWVIASNGVASPIVISHRYLLEFNPRESLVIGTFWNQSEKVISHRYLFNPK